MAESGIAPKYWANVVQSVVYIKNFISLTKQLNIISVETWFGYCQDISYLRLFRSVSYAYISLNLNISKLLSRLVKVHFLGYFRWDIYKLLNKATRAIYK